MTCVETKTLTCRFCGEPVLLNPETAEIMIKHDHQPLCPDCRAPHSEAALKDSRLRNMNALIAANDVKAQLEKYLSKEK